MSSQKSSTIQMKGDATLLMHAKTLMKRASATGDPTYHKLSDWLMELYNRRLVDELALDMENRTDASA